MSLLCLNESRAFAGGASRPASDTFLSSPFCRQFSCTRLGTVKLAMDRETRIYTIAEVADAELKIYTLAGEAVGATYAFPLADFWDERAGSVASFFSSALSTQLSATKVRQFAENSSSAANQFMDGKRRFILSLEASYPPGLAGQRLLIVQYGRNFYDENEDLLRGR